MPPNTIISTAFLLPTAVIANGETTGNGFTNPNNILLVDGDVASSNSNGGVASDITIGNFLTNLPQNAVVVGIEMELIAYRGSQTVPPITVTPYLFDNTNGASNYYPYVTPFTGLTTTIGTYVLGTPTYLFASSFTVDQINNMKMNIVVNGDVSIDSFLIKVYYYEQTPGTPVTPTVGTCTDCDSVIQVPEMRLALPFLINQSKFYLQAGSFTYVDGTPVQPGDVGGCGGEINFVFDEGKRKIAGQNFEENAIVDIATGSWTVLSSGIIEVDMFAVTNRGLEPKTPYGHNANLMSDHDANSKVIISNSGRFYKRFVRQCEADVTFSRPIDVEKDEADVVNPIHTLNFKGNGVTVQQNGSDPFQADVTIQGAGTGTPTLNSVSSATSGSVQVASYSWQHTSLGTDRLLTIQIAMEFGKTVTALTYNGIALNFIGATQFNGTRIEMWRQVAPSVGTHAIQVTFSSASYFSGGAESWVGVDQVTPIGATNSATGTSLTPSLVLNTTFDNSIIVDGLCTALTPILLTPGAGQIENWHQYANTDTRQGASSYEVAGSAPDAVTIDYSITQNTAWSLFAIEIKGLTTAVANLVVEDEGVVIDSNVSNMDFVGAGVTVTQTAPGQVQVSVPGGGGSLDVQENGVSVENPVTVMNFITNGGILSNPAGGEVDIDLTGLGSGGSSNITEQFDDFTSALESDVATDIYYTSGNFGIFSGTNLSSEQDHPGIVTLNTTADILKGFFQLQADETQVTGLLDWEDDFDITIVTRLRYSGGNAWEVLFNLDGGGTDIAQVAIDGTNGVRYDIGAGLVVTAVPTPANNAWVTLRYQLASGTLTITLDGITVFSGAITHTNSFGIVGSVTTATDLDGFDFDYVRTIYRNISSGGSSEKKVGVGNTDDIQYFNIQYLFTGDSSATSPYDVWDLTNTSATSPSHVNLGVSEYVTPNDNDYSAFFPDWVNGNYAFNATKQSIFQIVASVATPANEQCGIGFDIFGALSANKIFAQVGTNDVGLGFVRDISGNWFARAGDGAGFTETPITVTDGTRVFRMEYDPGNVTPQARYYVDGVLVATITTDLPTAVASIVAFTAGNAGGCTTLGTIGCPVFAIEI